MPYAKLVSYWDGSVSWVERLCVASMVHHGHPVAVYSYDPAALEKCGIGAEIRDAREIVSDADPARRYLAARRFSQFANLFRLHLQRQEKGIWVDLDCLMRKPLIRESNYIFGFSSTKKINNAVLHLPPDSPMINSYISAITADPLRTPWATFGRRLRREVEIMLGQSQPHITTLTNNGPRALTYFARKYDVLKHAMPIETFYPIPSKDANLFVDPQDKVTPKLSAENILVHLWHYRLKQLDILNATPPSSSYLGKACEQFGIAA